MLSKRILRNTICSLLLLVMMITSAFSFAIEYPCEGVANSNDVRVRKKASSSGSQLTTLKKGEAVTVLEASETKSGDVWYFIETAKGKKGYVLSDYLSVPEKDRIMAAENAQGATKMKLTVRASCGDYNGVGKNWTHYHEWNGIQVQNGNMEAFVGPNVELSLYSRIREQDKKPDTSMEKTVYLPTEEEIANGFTVTQKIKVTENSGRYAGNSAIWTVRFIFEPIK